MVAAALVADAPVLVHRLPKELPYFVPGVGAWPGVVVSATPPDGRSAATKMWRYEAQGPTGKVVSMRPVLALTRLTADLAGAILTVLQEDPGQSLGSSTASERRQLWGFLNEKTRNGGPDEVAQVWRTLDYRGQRKKLTVMELELKHKVALICRSVLVALPDSPARSRALEILDHDRKPPGCPL